VNKAFYWIIGLVVIIVVVLGYVRARSASSQPTTDQGQAATDSANTAP